MSLLLPHRRKYHAAESNVGLASREFDGVDDVVTVSPDSAINEIFDGGGSVAFWLRFDIVVKLKTFISKGSTSGDGWEILCATNSERFRFGHQFSTTNGLWGQAPSDGSMNDDAGIWTHWVVTYDSSSASNDPLIYKNGTVITGVEVFAPVGTAGSDSSESLRFGADSTPAQFIDGGLSDIRLYNKILSAFEVASLHAGTHISSGLVGHYLGQADTVNDLAGTNHGTNNGSIYIPSGPLGVALTPTFGYNSYEFDGDDDYISLGTVEEVLPANQDFSICGWVNMLDAQNTYNGILGHDGWDIIIRCISNATGFNFYLKDSAADLTVGTGTDFLGAGWRWFCAKWSSANGATLTVPGVGQDTEPTATWDMVNPTQELRLGMEYHIPGGRFMEGKIADFRVYAREITSAEETALSTGSPSAPTDMVRWYCTDYQHLTNTIVDFSGGTPPEDGTNNGAVYSLDGPLDLIDPPTFGNVGLEFDGASGVDLTNMLDGASEMSACFWFKGTVRDSYASLFVEGQQATGFFIQGTLDVLEARIDTTDGILHQLMVNDVFDGEWHHAAITYNGTTGLLYLDGVQEDTEAITGTVEASGIWYLGKRQTAGNNFTGNLADCRIYNRALSSTEVEQLSQGINVTSGIKGWWLTDTADTLPTIVDHSGWDNDGTATGTTASDGPFFSREFDGVDDYIDCGNDSSLNPTGDFTLACWFRVHTRTAEHFFIGRDDASLGRSYAFGIRSDGFLQLQINGGLTAHSGLGTDFDDAGNKNRWFHGVAVREAGVGTTLYLNRAVEVTGSDATPNVTTGPTTIGKRTFSSSQMEFDGNLADVRIYSRALSASEVTDLYNGDAVSSTGLEGHWLSGDNWDYNTVTDASGNNRHGTNVGSIASTEKFVHPANPDEVSGLQLWLDASDASTLYDATVGGSLVDDDGAVARWEDKSGNANHATQGTVANQPYRRATEINGLDVIDFDGSAHYLNLSSAITESTLTVFTVFQRATAGIDSFALGGTLSSEYSPFWYNLNNTYFASVEIGGASTDTGDFVFSGVMNDTDVDLWLNGASEGATGTRSSGPMTLQYVGENATRFHQGFMSEVVVYNRALSDEERISIERGLALKWGIS